MTKEQKELLLKDLCGRLPYKVKVQIKDGSKIYENCILEEIDCSDEEMSVAVKHENGELAGYDFDCAKPYLFPLSSMTEEQFKEYITIPSGHRTIDWFDKNHFDYRCLIEQGLSNNAEGKNIY